MEDDDDSAGLSQQWAGLPETQRRLQWAIDRRSQRVRDLIAFASQSIDPSCRALAADYYLLEDVIAVLKGGPT